MELDHWQKLDQLCHSALQVDESQRAAFLEQACSGDQSLKQEVESLLAHAERESFLPTSAAGSMRLAVTLALSTIGRYRILRLLGEGGMGAVYEAEQDQPRRTVALKIIKPGFSSPETLRRFQHESQALGRLQHPGIAQIYEASTADTGLGPLPYFAMELIRGQAVLEYADAHKLSARERLELMARICDAVDHAHQRGVIHRDLKPGNILVDDTGQPKVLDFGVARVTESDLQHTRQTDLGQLVGTLAYMSPEQVAGDSSALDTRSDVYALGLILYELLAGRLPYNLARKPVHEAIEVIREEEAAPLSSVQRSYRGDIDTIAAKALEKDKARRYASAAALAGDIRRYLADRPIDARPASAIYRVRKFARRHKALVAGTAAVFLVLVAGAVASTIEALRARNAEATAEAVNNFLQNDLLAQASASNQSSPTAKPDPDLKVRTALDRAAARITGKFDRQPEVEAAIRDTIGQTYMDLGLYPEAYKQFARALDLHRRVLGPEDPKTLKTMGRLGHAARYAGKYAEAETLLRQTLQIQRRTLGPSHPDTLDSLSNLAATYWAQGKFAQAEDPTRQALDARRRVLGTEHPDTLASMNSLANLYVEQRRYAEAVALHLKTLELRRRVLGPEHPETLGSMNNLAFVYNAQAKYPLAEQLFRETVQIENRVLGPRHLDTLRSMSNLALVLGTQGEYAQAELLFRQTLEIERHDLGLENFLTLQSMDDLANVYAAHEKYAQAEALLTQALETSRRVLGPENTYTLEALSDSASLYQRQGKFALAETYAAQTLAGLRHTVGSEESDTADAAADLALARLSQTKFAEGEPSAREALEFYGKKQPDDWQRFRAESLLGASLAGQKKYAEAEPLLVSGYQGMLARKDHIAIPDRHHLDLAGQWLIQLYEACGQPEKAAAWRQR